jgi:hypothetical protein
MSINELITIFLIVLADMASTYSLMVTHNTCSLERNPLLRRLCEVIGYNATWLWIPIEFIVIAVVYKFLKKLRKRLIALIEVEKIFLVLTIMPIINNVIHLLRTL